MKDSRQRLHFLNGKLLAYRLLAGLLVGVLIFLLSVLANWRAMGNQIAENGSTAHWGRAAIREATQVLESKRSAGEALPENLDAIAPDLRLKTFPNSYDVRMVRNGHIMDGWGHSLHYEVHGTSYTLKSLGWDGKPGGTGFDADFDINGTGFDYWKVPRTGRAPTLAGFLFQLPSRGMLWASVIAGVMGFLLTAIFINPITNTRRAYLLTAVAVLITTAVAIFFALGIAGLHVPSGH